MPPQATSPLTEQHGSASLTPPPADLSADLSAQIGIDPDWRNRLYTFEEYLDLVTPDGFRYELEEGKLILMAATTGLHQNICDYLAYWLAQAIAELALDLIVRTGAGLRTGPNTSRIPDLTVCHEDLWQQVVASPRAGVLAFEQPPVLVGEVVSQDRKIDYEKKRTEYARSGVPVYLLVDPKKLLVRLDQDPDRATATYCQTRTYRGGETLIFPGFPNLHLTAEEILRPPLVKDLLAEERRNRDRLVQELEQERQRADRLAALLRAQGIDPESDPEV